MLRLAYTLSLLVAVGCFSSNSSGGDAGAVDSSLAPDATRIDTGPPRMDAGPPPLLDAGPPPPVDAGPPPPVDAGPRLDAITPVTQLEEACAGLCGAGVACGFTDETSECNMGCLEYGRSSPDCEPAAAAFFECSTGLDCMALLTGFDDGREGACGMQFAVMEAVCPLVTPR